MDSPLTYALKYAAPGDRFPDAQVLNYPVGGGAASGRHHAFR